MVSILSYAPNSLPCGVGNSERLFMYCGFLWGNHSAVEHREEGVEDVGHARPTIGAEVPCHETFHPSDFNLLLPNFDEPYVGLAAGDRNVI